MGKINILVGKHCMEHPNVVRSLCSTYVLHTTDLAACDSLCKYPTTVKNITLAAAEMLQFASFYSDNKCLQKIGISESSLLFTALQRKIKVVVMDCITQSVCDELGIETLTVSPDSHDTSDSARPLVESPGSRLKIFKIAACL
ncbi:MAG: hypothetical protein K2I69_05645 [Muribaculaceae bacterium]|nr:hypothetical protein [Muribaculaceae bacterium]